MQIILLVGAKLQVIITKLGLRIQERGDVVKGAPVVQPGDDLFWFGRPRFILFLIHLVLFQVFYFIFYKKFNPVHLYIYLFHLNTFIKSSLIYSYLLSFCLSLLYISECISAGIFQLEHGKQILFMQSFQGLCYNS